MATNRSSSVRSVKTSVHGGAQKLSRKHEPVIQELSPTRQRSTAAAQRREARAVPAAPQRLYHRGTNLVPTGERLQACLAGSKQSILVDMLRRPSGATMEELREALAGGRRSWAEATVRSGFGWDLKLKGYGVRSTFDRAGVEHFHLVVPVGQRIPRHSPTRSHNH